AEVIVPSRLPRRPVVLDQGIDLTEMAQLRLSIDSAASNDLPTKPARRSPEHVVVVGAASGVGSTTISINLLAALRQRRLQAVLWNAADEHELAAVANSAKLAAATDVLLFDVGAEPTQKFDRLYDI